MELGSGWIGGSFFLLPFEKKSFTGEVCFGGWEFI